jgi:hypothetical protein
MTIATTALTSTGYDMGQEQRRTCLNCAESFTPDVRHARHQRYCSPPPCQAASKRASQAKWLAKPENRNYHRGAAAVARVQAWRQAHPDYSQRQARVPVDAATAPAPPLPPVTPPLPEVAPIVSAAQVAGNAADSASRLPLQERSGAPLQDLLGTPLQDVLYVQPPVLVGLIAHLWDSALQEDIAAALIRLIQLGHDICGGDHVRT